MYVNQFQLSSMSYESIDGYVRLSTNSAYSCAKSRTYTSHRAQQRNQTTSCLLWRINKCNSSFRTSFTTFAIRRRTTKNWRLNENNPSSTYRTVCCIWWSTRWSFKKTDRGEDFVLYEDEKLIIFTTTSNLSALKGSKHWFADGTFKVSNQSTCRRPLLITSLSRFVLTTSINCSHCMRLWSHL